MAKKVKTTRIAEESYTDARNILLSLAKEMGEKWPDKVNFFMATHGHPIYEAGTMGLTVAPAPDVVANNEGDGGKDD